MKPENIAAAEVLESAAFVLMVPGAFAKLAYARDENMITTSEFAPGAVCFCAVGSIRVAAENDPHKIAPALKALRRQLKPPMYWDIEGVNNTPDMTGPLMAEKMLLAAANLRGGK